MKKIIIILIIVGCCGVAALYFTIGKKQDISYVTAIVKKGEIIQTVSETGTIKATSEVNLSFLSFGKIEKMNVKVGDIIKEGELLAEQDFSGLVINKNEAMANLDVSKESLNKLLAGAAREDIAVAEANVKQAKVSYDEANKELDKTKKTVGENISQSQKILRDLESRATGDITAYEQAILSAETNLSNTKLTYQNSINNYKEIVLSTAKDKLSVANIAIDVIDRTINDGDGKNLISVRKSSCLSDTKNSYNNSLELLISANNALTTTKTEDSNGNVSNVINEILLALNKVFESLQNCFSALENSVISSSFSQSDLDILKSNISSQQTIIAAAISSAQAAKQNFDSSILDYDLNVSVSKNNLAQAKAAYDNASIIAKNVLATAIVSGEQQISTAESQVSKSKESWQVAQAQYEKIIASADRHDIALAQAKIRQAQALLEAINKKIENCKINSPINGTIIKTNYEIGEQAGAGQTVISISGEDKFKIETLISESDIAKIKMGNSANIIFDAFGSDIEFIGKVCFIEPAETVIQDVIYYKSEITLENAEQYKKNIKSGMTADVTIITAKKSNVLIMPSRAVIEKNNDKIVRMLVNGTINEALVKVGLRGDEGIVEVLSGVKEGDVVVTFIKEKK